MAELNTALLSAPWQRKVSFSLKVDPVILRVTCHAQTVTESQWTQHIVYVFVTYLFIFKYFLYIIFKITNSSIDYIVTCRQKEMQEHRNDLLC